MTTRRTNGGDANAKAMTKPDPRYMALRARLDTLQGAMREVLPKHLTAERLTKVVLGCVQRTPKLLDCTLPSIARSVMQAAELGLELGGLLGEAYLVPYGNEAQCIIGYQGLLKLARQSGEVRSITSRVVYSGERVHFNFAENTVEDLLTMEAMAARNEHNDNIVGAYALVTLASGEKVLEVMTRNQIELVRKRSRASNNGPWVTDYPAMCRKTVLRRVSKYIPKSAERLRQVLEHEEAQERGSVIDVGGLVEDPHAARSSELANAVMGRALSIDDAASPEEAAEYARAALEHLDSAPDVAAQEEEEES